MKNYIQPGRVLQYLNEGGEAVLSGAVVALPGGGYGVAMANIAVGEEGSVLVCEVVSLPKGAVAVDQGQRLYYDASDEAIVLAPAADAGYIGIAARSAESGDAEVDVLLVVGAPGVAANIADIATADGSDAGTTQTLANDTKAKVNAILAALKTAGLMTPDA